MLEVMKAIVESGQTSLQNQQALMLTLMSKFLAQPDEQPALDEVVQKELCDTEVQTEVVEAAAVEAKCQVDVVLPSNDYNTALGTVLLGGAPLSGSYAVTPKPNLRTALHQRDLSMSPDRSMHRRHASPTFLKALQEFSAKNDGGHAPAPEVVVRAHEHPAGELQQPIILACIDKLVGGCATIAEALKG